MAVPTYDTPEERNAIRTEQNQRIKAHMRDWQLKWHALFDADPLFGPNSEFPAGEKIPDKMDHDNRLIFGISQASPATRLACFAMLPQGDEMGARFESYMKGPLAKLPVGEIKPRLEAIQAAMEKCELNEDIAFSSPQVFTTQDDTSKAAFRLADRVRYLFERSGLEPYDEDKIAPSAALYFLTEPLYASAGNWYELCDWVTGAMGEPVEDACYALIYQLWTGGWKVGVTDAGLIAAPIR